MNFYGQLAVVVVCAAVVLALGMRLIHNHIYRD